MSKLEFGEENLSSVDYKKLFEGIKKGLDTMATEELFIMGNHSVVFAVDRLATSIALKVGSRADNPFENRNGTTYASVYLPDVDQKTAFSRQLEDLVVKPLRQRFEEALRQNNKPPLDQYASNLFRPLKSFSVPNLTQQTATGLLYPLEKPVQLTRRRLHFQKERSHEQDPWLKGHKLTIQVEHIDTFKKQVSDGIRAYLELEKVDKEYLEEAMEVLQQLASKDDGPFATLLEVFTAESLARIQRTAKIIYLEYLHKAMSARDVSQSEKIQGRRLLETLTRRLRLLEAYIQQHPDGYYQVTYGDKLLNLRDIFSRADALNPLPIITEIEGLLAESIDDLQGSKTFVNGLKLKLNGQVHIHGGEGEHAFDFHLGLLDPEKPTFQERRKEAEHNGTLEAFYMRVLRVALLYYFAFMEWENPTYQPAEHFEREILQVLREGEESQKVQVLRSLAQKLQVNTPKLLDVLREALVEFLKNPAQGPGPLQKTLVLCLKDDVLVKNVDSMVTHNIFFQECIQVGGERKREALKYIAIEEATVSRNALCKLPVHLLFEPMYFYETDDAQNEYKMTREIEGIYALPVFLAPANNNLRNLYNEKFSKVNMIMLRWSQNQQVQSRSDIVFVYRFVYQLLAYLFIQLIAEAAGTLERRKRFIPIVCLHVKTKEAEAQSRKYDNEDFMHVLSKTLAHMLAQDYRASSQGLHSATVAAQSNTDRYRLQNALSSLYAALPHRFQLPGSRQEQHPEKLAIIVVSSRKCDFNTKTPDAHLVTIYGEVIGVERLDNGQVRFAQLATFAGNERSQEMYKQPKIILKQVKECYDQGYHHFLYVAQAPYSRTLRLSEGGARQLYFMEHEVIQAMREVGPNVRVYPVFCDLYYVLNLLADKKKPLQPDSLYIDELKDLTSLAPDKSRRTVTFLNLFNGVTVPPKKKDDARFYNGMMSYSTLINVYEMDTVYDQYIWSDLLSKDEPDSIKEVLLHYITLLHFIRCEKVFDPGFKLNPYTRTIGDQSVGRLAVIGGMNGYVRFNMLAFLTLVRAVLRREQF